MKITKLLSVALVTVVLGLAACSKSSDSGPVAASQGTLVAAAANFGTAVSILPASWYTSPPSTQNGQLAYSVGSVITGGTGSFALPTLFGEVSLLSLGASSINTITTTADNITLPSTTGGGTPYTISTTIGDTLTVAAQIFENANGEYVLEFFLAADKLSASSGWVPELIATEKKDQSTGSITVYDVTAANPTTKATSYTWTKSETVNTYTLDSSSEAVQALAANQIQVSSLTYDTKAQSGTVQITGVGSITWNSDGTTN